MAQYAYSSEFYRYYLKFIELYWQPPHWGAAIILVIVVIVKNYFERTSITITDIVIFIILPLLLLLYMGRERKKISIPLTLETTNDYILLNTRTSQIQVFWQDITMVDTIKGHRSKRPGQYIFRTNKNFSFLIVNDLINIESFLAEVNSHVPNLKSTSRTIYT